MDVHQAVRIGTDDGFFEDAHEAGENDDVCSCAFEVIENFLLRRIAQTAGMRAGIDIESGQASLAGEFEEIGMFLIADGGDDVCVEGAALHGADDGAEVGAFPGTQDGEAQSGMLGLRRHFVDEAGGGAPWHERQDVDVAADAFQRSALSSIQRSRSVVTAFSVNMWLDFFDQGSGSLSMEDDDGVHCTQCGEYFGAVVFMVERTFWTFQKADRFVGVQTDHERIT